MKSKRIFFVAIIIASIFIINNLIQSIYTLWNKKELVVDLKNEAKIQEEKNQELKQKLSLINKPQFVEEQARNKLFLTKPGDEIVILSEKDIKGSQIGKPKPQDTRPNWKKWWDLFF